MLTLLSPAKKQEYIHQHPDCAFAKPIMLADTAILVKELKKYRAVQLAKLMSVSEALAKMNYERYKAFDLKKFNLNNSKQAVFAFQGDVYRGIDAEELTCDDLDFMQRHVAILSGLYGYLRPLDLIQPYRLEMKTALKNPRGKNLYEFWGDKITEQVNLALLEHSHRVVINLASNEYFKAIKPKLLEGDLIQVQFKEKKGDTYKTIGVHAKRARGLMTRFIVEDRIEDPKELKKFKLERYKYNKSLSKDNTLVFTRG